MIIPIDEVVHFDFLTHHPSTAAVTDADSTPTFDVYEEATDTGLLGATNATKRTSLTGDYRGTFTASAANGFEAGKWYTVIASATVNSIAGKGRVMHFRCGPAEAIAGVPKTDMDAISGDSAAADSLELSYDDTAGAVPWNGIVDQGTAQSVGANDIVLRSAAAFVDDALIGCTVVITNGTQVGSRSIITDYVGATDTATLGNGWTGATPTGTPTYKIFASAAGSGVAQTGDAYARLGAPAGASVSADIAAMKVDTAAILVDTGTTLDARIPAALVSGRMDSSVGAMAANVLTATAINADAITAAKIADGAIDAATFAAGAINAAAIAADAITDAKVAADVTIASVTGAVGSVTGAVGSVTGAVGSVAAGGITAASFAANAINASKLDPDVTTELQTGLSTLSGADILTQVNAALDAVIADSIPADGTRPSLRQAAYMQTQFLVERSVSGTTLTVRKVDGSTTLFTLTLNDATTPTAVTRAT